MTCLFHRWGREAVRNSDALLISPRKRGQRRMIPNLHCIALSPRQTPPPAASQGGISRGVRDLHPIPGRATDGSASFHSSIPQFLTQGIGFTTPY